MDPTYSLIAYVLLKVPTSSTCHSCEHAGLHVNLVQKPCCTGAGLKLWPSAYSFAFCNCIVITTQCSCIKDHSRQRHAQAEGKEEHPHHENAVGVTSTCQAAACCDAEPNDWPPLFNLAEGSNLCQAFQYICMSSLICVSSEGFLFLQL